MQAAYARSKGLRRVLERAVRGTITAVSTAEPVAALTFDDGPHPEVTPRLLDLLSTHDVRATFFMVGEAASHHPELVKRVADAGHAIGNHSWNHPSMPELTGAERRAQIRNAATALAPHESRLFRPPFGHQTLAGHLGARWLGYEVIAWSVAGHDSSADAAAPVVERLMRGLVPGAIALLHDGHYPPRSQPLDRTPTLQSVETVLAQLQGRLRFVTVPELLRLGKPVRRSWYLTP